MSRKSVPPIDPSDLRDQADADRIERIWNRLEPELHGGERALEPKAPSRHVWLIAAALAGTFGAGVWLGHAHSPREVDAASSAERAPEKAPDLFAAGSTSRTFPLANGGKLLVQPESMLELAEVSDTKMTLRLLRGSASIDATHAVGSDIAVVAGQARLTAPAGGSVAVTRHERDLDVTVSGGSVELESPNGPQVLGVGESARGVPILAPVASYDAPARRPEVVPPRPHESPKAPQSDEPAPRPTSQPSGPPPAIAVAVAPDWIDAVVKRNNYKEAADLITKDGGIEEAIKRAHSPRELAPLGELAQYMGRPELRWVADRRLVDEFPGDPLAGPLALVLSNHFRDEAKNPALADKYNALAQHGRLAEDASCEQLRHGEQSPALIEAAKEYERRYPQGHCREAAEQILGDASAEGAPKKSEPKQDEPKDDPKRDDASSPKKDASKEGAKADDPAHPAPSASAKAGPAAPAPSAKPSIAPKNAQTPPKD